MNNRHLKITLLLLALLQMGAVFMSPIISSLIETFPQYSASTCQMIMTIPNLVVIFVSILAGKLDPYISKKTFIITACLSIIIGTIGLLTFHNHLMIMFVFTALLGVGFGILLSVTATIVSVYFDSHEQGSIYGLQNTFTNLGGMILTVLAGFLSSIKWYYAFLSAFIIIPGFLCSLKYIPNEKGVAKKTSQEKVKMPKIVYFYCLIIIVFLVIFNILPTNLSIFISENQLGDNSISGIMSALVLLGGSVSGILFKKLNTLFKEKVICLGFLNLAIGFFIISISSHIALLALGCFIGGCSLSLIMSQLSLNISTNTHPAVAPVALSLVISGNNLGGFLSPIIFSMIPGSALAHKFFTIGISTLVCVIILLIIFNFLDKKQKNT